MRIAALSSMLAVAAVLACAGARADDDAERRAWIESAVRARDAGDHGRALELARAADARRPTSSLTRFLAEEHESLGHWAEAYDAARRCLHLAEGEEPSANHDAVLIGCRSIAAELRPRVAFVSVVAPEPRPAGLVVRVAGVARDASAGPVTVLPGAVRVEGEAPGFLPFASSIEVAAGGEATVCVALRPAPPPAATSGRQGRSLLGPVVAGAGVVALAAAGVLYLVSNGKYDEARATCTGGCPDAASKQSGVEQLDGAALGSAIAGAALVAVGATLFLLDRPSDATAPAGAWLEVTPSGAALRGRF